jgi:hypothetical protein
VTRVRFHAAASDEAEATVRWYNERVVGLGHDFRAELVAGIERIAQGPLIWPISAYDPRARRYPSLGSPIPSCTWCAAMVT